MEQLTTIKAVLEIVLISAFLILLLYIARKDGRHKALALLTNAP